MVAGTVHTLLTAMLDKKTANIQHTGTNNHLMALVHPDSRGPVSAYSQIKTLL